MSFLDFFKNRIGIKNKRDFRFLLLLYFWIIIIIYIYMIPFFWLKENSNFEVETEIKKSSIPGAGNGRFSLEDIKEGTLIRKLKFINIKDYITNSKLNKNTDINYFIIFNDYYDLNLLVEYFKSFKLLDEEEIKTKIAWFMGYIDNKLCIQSHSSYYNHSNEYNIKRIVDNEYLYHYANRDIEKNSELFIDYNDYIMPDYFFDWCRDNNIHGILSFL